MGITLYEKCDEQKLRQILECDNLPNDDKDWLPIFQKKLLWYHRKVLSP
jgi:hypothetical protein